MGDVPEKSKSKIPGLKFVIYIKNRKTEENVQAPPWFECLLCAPGIKLDSRDMVKHVLTTDHLLKTLKLQDANEYLQVKDLPTALEIRSKVIEFESKLGRQATECATPDTIEERRNNYLKIINSLQEEAEQKLATLTIEQLSCTTTEESNNGQKCEDNAKKIHLNNSNRENVRQKGNLNTLGKQVELSESNAQNINDAVCEESTVTKIVPEEKNGSRSLVSNIIEMKSSESSLEISEHNEKQDCAFNIKHIDEIPLPQSVEEMKLDKSTNGTDIHIKRMAGKILTPSSSNEAKINFELYSDISDNVIKKFEYFQKELLNLGQGRVQKQVVFLCDERECFLDEVKIPNVHFIVSKNLSFTSAFQLIKSCEYFNKCSLFIIMSGENTILEEVLDNDCTRINCSEKLLLYTTKYTKVDQILEYIITSAKNLQRSILLNTSQDNVLFTGIIPLNFILYNKHLSEQHARFSCHISINEILKKKNILFLMTVKAFLSYNAWTRYWCKKQGFIFDPMEANSFIYYKATKKTDFNKSILCSDGFSFKDEFRNERKSTVLKVSEVILKKLSYHEIIPEYSISKAFPVKKFEKIVIFSNSFYKPLLQKFESEKVSVLANQDMSFSTINNFMQIYGPVGAKNSLWILVTEIFPLVDTNFYKLCTSSCCPPLQHIALSKDKFTSFAQTQLTIKSIVEKFGELEPRILSNLDCSCSFIIAPAMPCILMNCSETSHDILHDINTKNPVTRCISLPNIKKLSETYKIFIKKLGELSTTLLKKQELCEKLFANYTNNYVSKSFFIQNEEESARSYTFHWDLLMEELIYLALTGFPCADFENTKNIPKSLESFTTKYDIIEIVGNKSYFSSLAKIDTPYIQFYDGDIFSEFSSHLKNNETLGKSILYLLVFDIPSFFKKTSSCIFCINKVETSLLEFEMPRVETFNELWHRIDVHVASLNKSLERNSTILILPLVPQKFFLSNTVLPHDELHKIVSDFPFHALVTGKKKAWNSRFSTFQNKWNSLIIEMTNKSGLSTSLLDKYIGLRFQSFHLLTEFSFNPHFTAFEKFQELVKSFVLSFSKYSSDISSALEKCVKVSTFKVEDSKNVLTDTSKCDPSIEATPVDMEVEYIESKTISTGKTISIYKDTAASAKKGIDTDHKSTSSSSINADSKTASTSKIIPPVNQSVDVVPSTNLQSNDANLYNPQQYCHPQMYPMMPSGYPNYGNWQMPPSQYPSMPVPGGVPNRGFLYPYSLVPPPPLPSATSVSKPPVLYGGGNANTESKPSKGKSPKVPAKPSVVRVAVHNIPSDLTDIDMKLLFAACGELVSFHRPQLSETTFGIAVFANSEDAYRATRVFQSVKVRGIFLKLAPLLSYKPEKEDLKVLMKDKEVSMEVKEIVDRFNLGSASEELNKDSTSKKADSNMNKTENTRVTESKNVSTSQAKLRLSSESYKKKEQVHTKNTNKNLNVFKQRVLESLELKGNDKELKSLPRKQSSSSKQLENLRPREKQNIEISKPVEPNYSETTIYLKSLEKLKNIVHASKRVSDNLEVTVYNLGTLFPGSFFRAVADQSSCMKEPYHVDGSYKYVFLFDDKKCASIFAVALHNYRAVDSVLKTYTHFRTSGMDVYRFKTQECPKHCNSLRCRFYHSAEDRRRHPKVFNYGKEMCPKFPNCPEKDSCYYCHSTAEQIYHPHVFHSAVCNSLDGEMKCKEAYTCPFAHPNTSEMFYQNAWNDMFLIGVHKSLEFIGGAISNLFHTTSSAGVSVFVFTPNVELVRIFVQGVSQIAEEHEVAVAGVVSGKQNPDGNDVIIAASSAIEVVLNKNIDINFSKLKVIIIDEINTVVNDRIHFERFKRVIDYIYGKITVTVDSINKVVVAETADLETLIASERVLQTTFSNVRKSEGWKSHHEYSTKSVSTSKSAASTGKSVASTSKSIASTNISSASTSQNKDTIEKSNNGTSDQSQRKRESSYEEGHTSAKKLKLEDPQDKLVKEIEAEYAVYLEIPEMHPKYEEHYEHLMNYIAQTAGKVSDEKVQKMWKNYWNIVINALKEEDLKLRQGDFDPNLVDALDRPEFSLLSSLNLLRELSPHLGIVGPAVKYWVESVENAGINSKKAKEMYANSESVGLLRMTIQKIKRLSSTESNIPLEKLSRAEEWTSQLLNYGLGKEVIAQDPKELINIESLAKLTVGKDSATTIKYIRNALKLKGMTDPSKEVVNKILMEVASIHCDLVLK